MTSFYSNEELLRLGFKSIGENVKISRYANFYGTENISINDHVRIDDYCILSGKIVIGSYVHIAAFCGVFAGYEGVEFCDFSTISSHCSVYAISDDYSGVYMTNPTVDGQYRNVHAGKVVIGKHVIVGSGSTILPGAIIGEGCAVGSMSLVKESLSEWGLYVGIPVRRIKDREKELLKYEHIMHERLSVDSIDLECR